MKLKLSLSYALTNYLTELAGAIVDNFIAFMLGILALGMVVVLLLVQCFFFLVFVLLIPVCFILDLINTIANRKK